MSRSPRLYSPSTPRRRPFAQLQIKENQSLSGGNLNVSYLSTESSTGKSPDLSIQTYGKPFARFIPKHMKDFDITYNSSAHSYDSATPESTPSKTNNIIYLPPFTRSKRKENLLNISYSSSSLESTENFENTSPPIASIQSRPFTHRHGKENQNLSNISLNSSSPWPKLLKKKLNASTISNSSLRQRKSRKTEILDDLSSSANSSIKGSPFKVPKPFGTRLKRAKNESMFNLSYKSNESISEEYSGTEVKLFKGTKNKSILLNDITYNSSKDDASSICDSPESDFSSIAESMNIDDIPRASVVTRDESLPELNISKMSNRSRATSLNLSVMSKTDNCFLANQDSELENEILKEPDSINLSNDDSTFILTPCRKSITSCKSQEETDDSINKSLNDKRKPFGQRQNIQQLNMTDLSYNSSKVDSQESSITENRQLFSNFNSGKNCLSSITYDSSIEANSTTLKSSSSSINRSSDSSKIESNNTSNLSSKSVENQENISIPKSCNSSISSRKNKSSILIQNESSVQQNTSSHETAMSPTVRTLRNRSLSVSQSNKSSKIESNDTKNNLSVDDCTPSISRNLMKQSSVNSRIVLNNISNISIPESRNSSITRSMRKHSLNGNQANVSVFNDTPINSNVETQENISIMESRPFEKMLENAQQTLASLSYMVSQDTPISKEKLAVGIRNIFGRKSGRPDINFSITYEESVDDVHEDTPEPEPMSSSSEESKELSSEKEISDAEEDKVDSVHEEMEIITENEDQVENAKSSLENRTNVEVSDQLTDKDMDNSLVENISVSSAVDENLNISVRSEGFPENSHEAESLNITEAFLSSINNITVLPENPKNKIDDTERKIEEKIAEIKKLAMEKSNNRYKFSYPISPRNIKKNNNLNKKTLTLRKYPKPKLFKPARWANKRLYDYLSKCLAYKGLNRMLEAEQVVKIMHETVELVTHSKTHEKNAINRLKIELASRKIITTTFDFYTFVRNYLPTYFEYKVIPSVQPYTNIVWPPKDNCRESEAIIPE